MSSIIMYYILGQKIHNFIKKGLDNCRDRSSKVKKVNKRLYRDMRSIEKTNRSYKWLPFQRKSRPIKSVGFFVCRHFTIG